jgi:hypothetical protein
MPKLNAPSNNDQIRDKSIETFLLSPKIADTLSKLVGRGDPFLFYNMYDMWVREGYVEEVRNRLVREGSLADYALAPVIERDILQSELDLLANLTCTACLDDFSQEPERPIYQRIDTTGDFLHQKCYLESDTIDALSLGVSYRFLEVALTTGPKSARSFYKKLLPSAKN